MTNTWQEYASKFGGAVLGAGAGFGYEALFAGTDVNDPCTGIPTFIAFGVSMGGRMIAERGNSFTAFLGALTLVIAIESLSQLNNLNGVEKVAMVGAAIESIIIIANWRHGFSKNKHRSNGQSWQLPEALFKEDMEVEEYQRQLAAMQRARTPINVNGAQPIYEASGAPALGAGWASWAVELENKKFVRSHQVIANNSIAQCVLVDKHHYKIDLLLPDEHGKTLSFYMPDWCNQKQRKTMLDNIERAWHEIQDEYLMRATFLGFRDYFYGHEREGK